MTKATPSSKINEPACVNNPARAGTTRPEQLRKLLKRKSGASITEIQDTFNWQPHTARAAISGLRKAGEIIERSAGEAGAVYRIIKQPAKA